MTKILIADDEAHIRTLANAIFKSLNMTVVLAHDGQDAIQKIKKENPDIILTDINMPKKSGFDVCKFVRGSETFRNTPLIMVSAMGDDFNKITGFEEGADDYVTKPFNIEELKARVKSLLKRTQRGPIAPAKEELATVHATDEIDIISTGVSGLDNCLAGGLPAGSNILVLGLIGSGKSSFARQFIKSGLENNESCLFVAVDDSPMQIRKQLNTQLKRKVSEYEAQNTLRFIDAFSWSSLTPPPEEERYALSGVLDLNPLSGAISDASHDIGHTIQKKRGGRRVIDSLSSLLINFELSAVQRFVTQIARTSLSFGNVTTLFIVEEGTVSEQVLNNMKYLMDGVIEFGEQEMGRAVRVSSMKWIRSNPEWQPLD